MEAILSIVLVAFFSLYGIWLLIAIAQGILYIVYQKSDKHYFSPLVRCCSESIGFSLEYKKKQVDIGFSYTKYKGYYYILGLQGIYKVNFFHFSKLNTTELQTYESTIIDEMQKECMIKVLKNQELLHSFLETYRGQG